MIKRNFKHVIILIVIAIAPLGFLLTNAREDISVFSSIAKFVKRIFVKDIIGKNLMGPTIYIVIAPVNIPDTGDYDYAMILSKNLNSAATIKLVTNELEAQKMQIDAKNGDIIHHIRNFSSSGKATGSSLGLEAINIMKGRGVKYLFAPIEPKRIHFHPEEKAIYKSLYSLADQVVVHSAIEKSFVDSEYSVDSKVIPIPNTIETRLPDMSEKFQPGALDILHFGMIREWKGVEQACQLADFLDKQKENRKVIIAGSVTESTSLSLLANLLKCAHKHNQEHLNIIDQLVTSTKSESEKKQSLCDWHKNIPPASKTLEVHLNIDSQKLEELASRCSYSFYYYHSKGLSSRLSGFSNSIHNGIKIYSAAGYDTGHDLKLSKSCTILSKPNASFEENQYIDGMSAAIFPDSIFYEMLNDMKSLESNAKLREETIKSLERDRENYSVSEVCKAYKKCYGDILGVSSAE